MPRILLLVSSLILVAQGAQRSPLLEAANSPYDLARYIETHTVID